MPSRMTGSRRPEIAVHANEIEFGGADHIRLRIHERAETVVLDQELPRIHVDHDKGAGLQGGSPASPYASERGMPQSARRRDTSPDADTLCPTAPPSQRRARGTWPTHSVPVLSDGHSTQRTGCGSSRAHGRAVPAGGEPRKPVGTHAGSSAERTPCGADPGTHSTTANCRHSRL